MPQLRHSPSGHGGHARERNVGGEQRFGLGALQPDPADRLGLSIAGLLLTAKAAPIMLSLATPQSASANRHAFDEFFLWGLFLRGFADTLAFGGLQGRNEIFRIHGPLHINLTDGKRRQARFARAR